MKLLWTTNPEKEDLEKQVNKLLSKSGMIVSFKNNKRNIFYSWLPCILVALLCLGKSTAVKAQISLGDSEKINLDYTQPKTYTIGGIVVGGVKYLDPSVLTMLSGLTVGDKIKIPSDDIANAIKKLWEQGLFEDVKISLVKIEDGEAFLEIWLKERPRLSKFAFKGSKVKKSQIDDLREKLSLTRGDVVTENLMVRAENIIKQYYVGKGYLNAEVYIQQIPDTTTSNSVILNFNIDRNQKVKIYDINIEGNSALTDYQIKKAMKETKEKGVFKPGANIEKLIYDIVKNTIKFDFEEAVNDIENYAHENVKIRIFKPSKYIESDFKEDLNSVIAKYQEIGYRDAQIANDSVINNGDNTVSVSINIDEGKQYHFRNITFVGNTVYPTELLRERLDIKKGDIYNKQLLDNNLNFNQNGLDVSSLYLDNGYLFFSATPVEVNVENDSIDLEIRIHEGQQARINRVTVKGNTKTNDHVIMREIRTLPGDLFSRAQVIRTIRELSQLKYFNNEGLQPDIQPNYKDGTVDIEYVVEEASADQIELAGGYGYGRVIGTIGLSFNNFSLKNIFNGKAYRPIPSGDGQKLSLRLQTYGKGYLSYSFSFTEPWLGGKKPNSLTLSYYHSLYRSEAAKSDPSYYEFKVDGLSVGLGRRLKWPDDFFTAGISLNLNKYKLKNYKIFSFDQTGNGDYYNINFALNIGRNSTDDPIYPRRGSDFLFSAELTPPYSLFQNKNYDRLSPAERYKWIEYHKWKFTASVFTEIAPKLVIHSRAKLGFLGAYNQNVGVTPFERFYLGGDGLSNYNNFDGREIIGMRGYTSQAIVPQNNKGLGGTIFSKYTLELRYPLTLAPSSKIFAFSFLEAGNTWGSFDSYAPFQLYRTVGVGVRIFLPIFGIIGLDYGYGLDDIPGNPNAGKGQFHFSLNNSID
ncbi:MAG: outer membrane protein assembly factor [Bacteroidales bacterium]